MEKYVEHNIIVKVILISEIFFFSFHLHNCTEYLEWPTYVCQISHQTVLCDVVSRDVTDRCYSSILLALKRRPILRHRCSNSSSLRSWSTVSPLSVLPVPDTPGMLTHSNSSYIGAIASFSGRWTVLHSDAVLIPQRKKCFPRLLHV